MKLYTLTHTHIQSSLEDINNLKLICSLLGNGLVCSPKHEGTVIPDYWHSYLLVHWLKQKV